LGLKHVAEKLAYKVELCLDWNLGFYRTTGKSATGRKPSK